MTMEPGSKKESVDILEVSPNLSYASQHMIKMRCSQISQPHVYLLDKIGNAATEMNYDVLLAVDQKNFENCEVCLVGTVLGSGFIHTNELSTNNLPGPTIKTCTNLPWK